MRERLRRWLHDRGHHALCHICQERVLDHIDYSKEYIRGADGELIDVTTWGGTAVYKQDDKGKTVYREIHT